MNTNLFSSYTLDERMEFLNNQGEFISRISFYGYLVNLYIYDRFFIEVYYNRFSNAIVDIELMDPKAPRLHQYVADLNLDSIYKK
jgi:hypothetical protein